MQTIIQFISQWLGGLPDLLISFSGIALCVLAAGTFWDRRIALNELVGTLFCGVAIAFHQFFAGFFSRTLDLDKDVITWSIILSSATILALFYLKRRVVGSRKLVTQGEDQSSALFGEPSGRTVRGTTIGAPIIIILFALAVFTTGLFTPQAMVGDEVTHFYMLTHQAEDLSKPNFIAEIPLATGEIEQRRYPHSFLWHYFGAVIYHYTGGSFLSIQIYQTFFLVQFLMIGYLLACDRRGVESRSALLFTLVLASLPITLIFSVTLYQDVPLTAQILTAFYFLRRDRWFLASLFLSLAIGFKVTAVLFYPAFYVLLFYWVVKKYAWFRGVAVVACSLIIVLGSTWLIGQAIVTYGNRTFYPIEQLERIAEKVQETFAADVPEAKKKTDTPPMGTGHSAPPAKPKLTKGQPAPIIANHPGDLRLKVNYLIYGGVVLWLLFLLGFIGTFYSGSRPKYPNGNKDSSGWLLFVGGTYTLLAAWFIRTSPDVRYFLPGLPFLLLPLVEKTVNLPKPRIIISIAATLALLQSGYVLAKVYRLRVITPAIQDGITFLQSHPPKGRIFMYPEGNYRFFPAKHEWYLGYRLRDFWRAGNDERIDLLSQHNVEMLVIKKYLISQVDKQITNLGVYPVEFVESIESDSRFTKLYSNSELLIYTFKQN